MPKPRLMLGGVIVGLLGLVLVGLGPRLGLERPEPLAASIIGISLSLMGLDGLITGQIRYRRGHRDIYVSGRTARLRGAVMALGGLGLAIVGLFEFVEPGSFGRFTRQPLGQGALLVSLGLLGLTTGASWLLSRERIGSSQALSLLSTLPGRIVGLAFMLVSLAMVVAGALRIVAPATLDSLFENLMRSLAPSS